MPLSVVPSVALVRDWVVHLGRSDLWHLFFVCQMVRLCYNITEVHKKNTLTCWYVFRDMSHVLALINYSAALLGGQ